MNWRDGEADYIAKRDGIDRALAVRQLANGLCRASGDQTRVCSTPHSCWRDGTCLSDVLASHIQERERAYQELAVLVARSVGKATAARYRIRKTRHLGHVVKLVCEDDSFRATWEIRKADWERLIQDGIVAAPGVLGNNDVILGPRGEELAAGEGHE